MPLASPPLGNQRKSEGCCYGFGLTLLILSPAGNLVLAKNNKTGWHLCDCDRGEAGIKALGMEEDKLAFEAFQQAQGAISYSIPETLACSIRLEYLMNSSTSGLNEPIEETRAVDSDYGST